LNRARFSGLHAQEQQARAQHQKEKGGHRELRPHRVPGHDRYERSEPLRQRPSGARPRFGVEYPLFEVGGRVDERQRADFFRRSQLGIQGLSPRRLLRVTDSGRPRELVELIVEQVENDLVELLRIHDLVTPCSASS
jgi:hypothetical protein